MDLTHTSRWNRVHTRARTERPRLRLEALENRSLPSGTPGVADFASLSADPRLFRADDVLVQLRPGSDPASILAPGGHPLAATDLGGGLYQVLLPSGLGVADAVGFYQSLAGVAFAQPDYQVSVASSPILPNDPSFGSQWGLNNTGQSGGTAGADIGAPAAWGVTTGTGRTVVAVIDTGMDYDHPDLYRNVWINQAEIPSDIRASLIDVDGDGRIGFADLNDARNQGAGKIADVNGDGRIDAADVLAPRSQGGWADGSDNDNNGYTDDLVGWNFSGSTNNPLDDNGHGTHVSGIIGATGNNGVGVAGVDWNVQIMPLKFLDSTGSGYTSDAVKALNFAVAHGATVSNNSYGGGGYDPAMASAIANAQAHGHIFVAAAGNSGLNNDSSTAYPADYPYDNVVAVAATDRNDNLASFSDYGANSVDLGAPGVSILSTYKGGGYATLSGTSMATPFVTGAMALVRDLHPDWTYKQVIDQVLNTVDPVASLSGKTITGGRLDLARAVGAAVTTGPASPANGSTTAPSGSSTQSPTNTSPAPAPTPAPSPAPGPSPTSPTSPTQPAQPSGGAQPTGPAAQPAGGMPFAAAADAGGAPVIRVYNPDGSLRFMIQAFDASFTGGVRVAVGDVNGDGTPDVIAGAGPGGPPLVRIFDGKTGGLIREFAAYESSFTGGVFVAAGDYNGDGLADVVTTPDEGGGPRVRIFSGKDGSVLADFLGIDDANFRGGARVAVGDVNGDGKADLIVGAGFGGGPRVAVFDGGSLQAGNPRKLVGDFFVFEQALRNGVYLAAGDLDGDGFADLVIGGGPGGGPRVLVLSGKVLVSGGGADAAQVGNFFAGDASQRGGVRVATGDTNGDGTADVITGTGPGTTPRARTFDGRTFGPVADIALLDSAFNGGVFVG